MKAFELHEPRSVREAVALLDRHGARAKVVAGGSDLVTGT
jgi:CO/xanthine dehydrogenase FAD-binding subunit